MIYLEHNCRKYVLPLLFGCSHFSFHFLVISVNVLHYSALPTIEGWILKLLKFFLELRFRTPIRDKDRAATRQTVPESRSVQGTSSLSKRSDFETAQTPEFLESFLFLDRNTDTFFIHLQRNSTSHLLCVSKLYHPRKCE